ncbi:VOC family protein [Fodinibius sp. Rm-B-1B1-1]|uniref:VOC family protein n=1 Tax=Fodinibius alkaliphilus TaxID=3140241 RepID=UPI00315A1D9A
MFKNNAAFSSFSVDDLAKANKFYSQTLGLKVTKEEMGHLVLHLDGGTETMIYPKGEDHVTANFTILNFLVEDIDSAVEQLSASGVKFEQYEGDLKTDEHGIFRGGPLMAWFKDPAGNILSIIQDE